MELLAQLYDIATAIGVSNEAGWLASVESYRLAGHGEPVFKAALVALEQRAGGYWIDVPSGDLSTHTLSDTRFIHRDMCVNCCSLRENHLDTGQCLFAPGSTFEETKP